MTPAVIIDLAGFTCVKEKTSWNNSNTVLMIQLRGRRVVTDYKNWQKKFALCITINVH